MATTELQPGDPGYSAPIDEPIADPTKNPTYTGATSEIISGDTPTMTLSDQQEKISGAQTALKGVTSDASSALQGVQAPTVGYQGYDAEKLKEESALGVGSEYVSPEATVAGQLEKLLAGDSKYMQESERRAKEQAASLGLLGSSAAVAATQRAAIESALPIAQQDAKTYSQFALAEQQTSNEMSRMKAESDLSAAAREHVYDIDTAKGKLNATFNQIAENAKLEGNLIMETTLKEIGAQWDAEVNTTLKNLDAKLQSQLAAQEISAAEREYASKTSSQIMAAAYGTINDLLGNADFMAGYADNPEALTQVFNNFINMAKNQTEFIGATAGLADEYFMSSDGLTGYGNLIGSWQPINFTFDTGEDETTTA